MNKRRKKKFVKIIDDAIKFPDKAGNGTLKMTASIDQKGRLAHYSLTYINPRVCGIDNGRVLGYDNSHGYHHRHYMGEEQSIDFHSFEDIVQKFDQEWRELHEKVKRKTYY